MSKTTIPSGGISSDIALDGNISVTGTTPSITVGDAGAEDAKIVFDGNAQDFHIGLDDSADDLIIGKGSALGTTANVVIDENGHVTMPLQSAVLVGVSSDHDDGGSTTTVQLNSEIYDQNSDFNTSNYTFTAPVTGKYLITVSVDCYAMRGSLWNSARVDTSNRTYYSLNTPSDQVTGNNYYVAQLTAVADMDANDTAIVKVQTNDDETYTVRGDATNSYCSFLLVA